jgi:hypothetical protein
MLQPQPIKIVQLHYVVGANDWLSVITALCENEGAARTVFDDVFVRNYQRNVLVTVQPE